MLHLRTALETTKRACQKLYYINHVFWNALLFSHCKSQVPQKYFLLKNKKSPDTSESCHNPLPLLAVKPCCLAVEVHGCQTKVQRSLETLWCKGCYWVLQRWSRRPRDQGQGTSVQVVLVPLIIIFVKPCTNLLLPKIVFVCIFCFCIPV